MQKTVAINPVTSNKFVFSAFFLYLSLMDNIQFWLYLIIGAIYLISRMKKKPQSEEPQDIPSYEPEKPVKRFEQPPAKPAPTAKALTFEELLKEITEGKAESTTAEVVDYDDDLKSEEKDLEEVDYDYRKKDSIYQVYDNAKAQAFNRASLEETMKLEDTEVTYSRFKGFELEEKEDLLAKYLADLKDPEGFKKAVVMGEILNRRF